jgi:hypothetical protein
VLQRCNVATLECKGTGATTVGRRYTAPVMKSIFVCALGNEELHGDKRKNTHTTERVLFSISRAERCVVGELGGSSFFAADHDANTVKPRTKSIFS